MRPCCCKEEGCGIQSGFSIIIKHGASDLYPEGATTTYTEIKDKYDIPESVDGLEVFWEADKGIPESIEFRFDKGNKYAYYAGLNWTQGRLPPASIERDVLDASNTSPIEVITSVEHGFTTGDKVDLVGAIGNTAANGEWNVVVIDKYTFSLLGSTGNGDFDITSNATVKMSDITAPTIKETFFSYLIGSEIGYFNTTADWDYEKDTLRETTLRMFSEGYSRKYPTIRGTDASDDLIFEPPELSIALAQDVDNLLFRDSRAFSEPKVWTTQDFSFKTKPDFDKYFSESDMSSYSLLIDFAPTVQPYNFASVNVAIKDPVEGGPTSVTLLTLSYKASWSASYADHRKVGGTLTAFDISDDDSATLQTLLNSTESLSGIPDENITEVLFTSIEAQQPSTNSTATMKDKYDITIQLLKDNPVDDLIFYRRDEDGNVLNNCDGIKYARAPINKTYVTYIDPKGNWINGNDINIFMRKKYTYVDPDFLRNIRNISQAEAPNAPVIVTISGVHGFEDGDKVRIFDVNGAMGDEIDGDWYIDVISENSFSLRNAPLVSFLDYSGGGQVRQFLQKEVEYLINIGRQASVSNSCAAVVADCGDFGFKSGDTTDKFCDPVLPPVQNMKKPFISSFMNWEPDLENCRFSNYDDYKNDYLSKATMFTQNGYRHYNNQSYLATPRYGADKLIKECAPPKEASDYKIYTIKGTFIKYDLDTWHEANDPNPSQFPIEGSPCVEGFTPKHQMKFECVNNASLSSKVYPTCYWDFPKDIDEMAPMTPDRFMNLELLTGEKFYIYGSKRVGEDLHIQEYVSQWPATFYESALYEFPTSADAGLLFGQSPSCTWEECVTEVGKTFGGSIFNPSLDSVGPTEAFPNLSSSPIEIKVGGPHGLKNNDLVIVKGVLGNTAANNNSPGAPERWSITVTGPDTFLLNGSDSNGTYAGSGTVTHRVDSVEPPAYKAEPITGKPYIVKIKPDKTGWHYHGCIKTRWDALDYEDDIIYEDEEVDPSGASIKKVESKDPGWIQENLCNTTKKYVTELWYKHKLNSLTLPFIGSFGHDENYPEGEGKAIAHLAAQTWIRSQVIEATTLLREGSVPCIWETDGSWVDIGGIEAAAINSGYSNGMLDVQFDTKEYHLQNSCQATNQQDTTGAYFTMGDSAFDQGYNIAGHKLSLKPTWWGSCNLAIPDRPMHKLTQGDWGIHNKVMSGYDFTTRNYYKVDTNWVTCHPELDGQGRYSKSCMYAPSADIEHKKCLSYGRPSWGNDFEGTCSLLTDPIQPIPAIHIGEFSIDLDLYNPVTKISECYDGIDPFYVPPVVDCIDSDSKCCDGTIELFDGSIYCKFTLADNIITMDGEHKEVYVNVSDVSPPFAIATSAGTKIIEWNLGCNVYFDFASSLPIKGSTTDNCNHSGVISRTPSEYFYTTTVASAQVEWELNDTHVVTTNIVFGGTVTICTDVRGCGPCSVCIKEGATCTSCADGTQHIITPLTPSTTRRTQNIIKCLGKCKNRAYPLDSDIEYWPRAICGVEDWTGCCTSASPLWWTGSGACSHMTTRLLRVHISQLGGV